jgi:hypothetical protein
MMAPFVYEYAHEPEWVVIDSMMSGLPNRDQYILNYLNIS